MTEHRQEVAESLAELSVVTRLWIEEDDHKLLEKVRVSDELAEHELGQGRCSTRLDRRVF